MTGPAITIDAGGVTITNTPITSGSGYELVGCGVTDITRRRDLETSPYVDGAAEISSVVEEVTYTLVARCVGSTWANTATLRANLTAAGTQETWTLTETIGGVTRTYTCRAANVSAPLDGDLMVTNRALVTLTIPTKET